MDTYGFPLSGLTEADQATRQRALARDRKVAKEWDPRALPTWQPDLSVPSTVPRKLKQLVRKGIPQELRPRLWLQFSGGLALRSHSPENHYQALLAAAPRLAKSSLLQLDSATAKTFPGLRLLATDSGREAVRRLARAYSQHTQKAALLGDSALLSLAAFLLAVVGVQREEDAFWTLVGLVETRLSSLALLQGESYSSLEAKVLETIAVKKCPRLASLLSLLDMPFQNLLRHWLPALFTQCLPAETAVRVWDVLLVEESPACFRIGVAMIKMNEPALVTSCRSGLVDRSLSWRVAHTFDADALFKMAFGTVLPLLIMLMVHSGQRIPQQRTAGISGVLSEMTDDSVGSSQ
ncbi:hypothetical protein WJX84_005091 [Apatococcus fuscideae]|uniref:Rab-GAP TBC domain-containing protein n=1 Tax=Apatococcus fuscideae TaxID=2026836 RepID=A0AAW1T347_9CHLO